MLVVTNKADTLEGLLDPSEKQFNRPTSAVEISDLLCAGIEVIRQDAQHLSRVGRDPHLAHRILHRIATAPGLAYREKSDAVGQDVPALGDSQLFYHLERRVGFEAGDDAATDGIELGPPSVIVVNEIEAIGRARRDRTL